MGYWIAVHVRIMSSSVMYYGEFRMWDMVLRRYLMMQCEMFLISHLRNTSRIAMLVSGRVRVGDLGDVLFKLW